MMKLTPRNSPLAPTAVGGYSQALEVEGARRLLFVSGQIPVTVGDHAPALTVIITGIFDEQWLLEIEAIAAD
jgi:enamine deaminase RidA (YjgF/YER057c/UK114 family)